MSDHHSYLMKRLYKTQQKLPVFGYSYSMGEYYAIYNKPLELPTNTKEIEEANAMPVKEIYHLVEL